VNPSDKHDLLIEIWNTIKDCRDNLNAICLDPSNITDSLSDALGFLDDYISEVELDMLEDGN